MSSRPRLLMLGAGLFQLAAIRRARELGCLVITLDNVPESPGHQLADESVHCSTTDASGVLAAARERGVDAVYSMASDVALPSLAAVADALGLPGPRPEVVECLRSKDRLRALQLERGLPHPAFAVGEELEDLLERLPASRSGLVVKPPDSSGSRGVGVVADGDEEGLRRAFAEARRHSGSGLVCVEELVEGEDVSADGLVVDGELRTPGFTRKFRSGLVPVGHRLPGRLSPAEEELARSSLSALFEEIGHRSGPFDADLRVSGDRAVVLEAAPRLGGNGMPLVAGAHVGLDLVGESLAWALGRDLPAPASSDETRRGVGSVLITSPRDGRLARVADPAGLPGRVAGLLAIELSVRVGDRVRAFRHGGDVLGYALVECDSDEDHERVRTELDRALELRIEPESDPAAG